MRNISKLALLSLFSLFSIVAWAANTPEQVVNEMLTKMKAAGNFSPVVEFIHWPTAYKQMLEGKPNAVFVASSPNELKEVVRKFVVAPSELVKEKFAPTMAALPEEQRKSMEAMLSQQLSKVDQEAKQRAADLVQATFKVKNTTVSNGGAKVEVEQTIAGKVDLWTLNLQQIDGEWYLPVFDPSMIKSPEAAMPPVSAQ